MAEELKSIVAAAVAGGSDSRTSSPTAAEDSGNYTPEPVRGSNRKRGETAAHAGLKRLALLWAQSRGYSVCAFEVQLPRCRFRADLAAYRPNGKEIGTSAIFECKQAFPDLRRDNDCSAVTAKRLQKVFQRRQILEKNLRIHYPALRIPDSLFSDFDSHNFAAIEHRGYARVLRELSALQNRLFDCTKFERLIRYRCANLFFLVVSKRLFREPEIPFGWGALIESQGELVLVRKPLWHEVTSANRLKLLERIAAAGTRLLNKQSEITFDDVCAARNRSCP